jgi:hypothetical protein
MKKINFIAIELWILLVIVITEGVSELQSDRQISIFFNNLTIDFNKYSSHLITGNQLICTEAHSLDLRKIWSTIQVKIFFYCFTVILIIVDV